MRKYRKHYCIHWHRRSVEPKILLKQENINKHTDWKLSSRFNSYYNVILRHRRCKVGLLQLVILQHVTSEHWQTSASTDLSCSGSRWYSSAWTHQCGSCPAHCLPIRARWSHQCGSCPAPPSTHQSKNYIQDRHNYVFKIRRTPSSSSDMIKEYKPQRKLRSSSRLLLKEPTFQTVTGRRSFRYVAAKTWNKQSSGNNNVDRHSNHLGVRRKLCYQWLFRQS